MEAIRDTFLPGLSLSDAVVFATLIVDVFQTADTATIFQNGIEGENSVLNESDQVSTRLTELSVPPSHGNSFKILIDIPMLLLVGTRNQWQTELLGGGAYVHIFVFSCSCTVNFF